jgi:hypothetical protein
VTQQPASSPPIIAPIKHDNNNICHLEAMISLLQAIVSFTATKIKMREVGWLESFEVEVVFWRGREGMLLV